MAPPSRALRVAFLHPDLGLGGAERLVVDAAAGLAARGCAVSVFTNHFDPARAFAEARGAGGFRVREHGAWIPRTLPLLGLHMLLAVAQNLWLALVVALAAWRAGGAAGGGGGDDAFDVLVCDQVSACVPLLRLLLPRAAVLFYCHYPDQLLAPHRSALQRLYRAPFDLLEEVTTGLADAVLVNSNFTRAAFAATFRRLAFVAPQVLYPCIAIAPQEPEPEPAEGGGGAPIVLLSINRFERKKGIATAIRGAALLRGLLPAALFRRVHLVVAGGYDARVAENVEHHRELLAVAEAEGLAAEDAEEGDVDGAGAGAGAGVEAGASAEGGRSASPAARKRRGSGIAAAAAAGSASPTSPAASAAATAEGGVWRTGAADLCRVIADWPPAPAPAAGGAPAAAFAQTQVGARVSFVRSFSDEQKRSLLRACAAVVYTPPNEHFGIVPLECMAAARPVVACSSGGPLESVRHGVTGLLCEPTPEAFARAMALVVEDARRAREMGRAGRLHVERGFSRDAFAEQLERAARTAIAGLWPGRAAAARGRARLWALLGAGFVAVLAAAASAAALLARAAPMRR